MPSHGIAALLAAALALAGAAAGAEPEAEAPPPRIYKWVDENGIAHYTTDRERIPRALRDRFVLPEAAPAPTPRSVAPPAAESPSGAALPEGPVPGAPSGEAAAAEREPAAAGPAGRPEGRRAPSEAWAEMDRGEPGDAVLERDLRGAGDFAAADAGPVSLAELDERIRALEAEIQSDEDALKALLDAPLDDAPTRIADDPALREVAERLPDRIESLRALREERGARAADGEGGDESEGN